MNNKQKISDDNRKLYKIPSGASYQLRSKNAIYVSPSNSVKHEMSKSLGAYMLRKWGDIKFSRMMIIHLDELQKEVGKVMKDFVPDRTDYITECVPKKEPGRRVDLVSLKDDTRYEFVVTSLPEGAKTDGSVIIKI